MKKSILLILLACLLFSCEKNSFTETVNSVKTADSLLTNTRKQIRSLDSLRKTITDSPSIARKVIVPEINRQKKSLDSVLKNGVYSVDSLSKHVDKVAKTVKIGTTVAKSLDSATEAITNGADPLKALTGAADKILKQTRKTQTANSAPPAGEEKKEPEQRGTPVSKTAVLEFEVQDLNAATEALQQHLKQADAKLMGEHFSTTENIQREKFEIKVPLENFETLITGLSANLGTMTLRNIVREGTVERPFTACDVTVTLVFEGGKAAAIPPPSAADNTVSTYPSSVETAKSEKTEESFLQSLLPFWPLAVLLVIILVLVTRRGKNKSTQRPVTGAPDSRETAADERDVTAHTPEAKAVKPEGSEETPDYSKYMPKDKSD